MPKQLLVTGDDFGADAHANAAIAMAHREGILTSASLMVTGEAVEEAVERARALPDLSTGLHLVLCDGRAASPPARIPGLADVQGCLPASPLWAGLDYWWRRRRLREAIAAEIRMQVERYLRTGLSLDHIDGHHHLHMHPVIFDLLLDVMEEYRVSWIRLVDEDAVGRIPPWAVAGETVPLVFRGLAARHRRRLRARGTVAAPERVYGLRRTGRLEATWLRRLLRRLRARCVEVYAHPSYATHAGRLETEALCDADVRRAVRSAGYSLANSRDLAGTTWRETA